MRGFSNRLWVVICVLLLVACQQAEVTDNESYLSVASVVDTPSSSATAQPTSTFGTVSPSATVPKVLAV